MRLPERDVTWQFVLNIGWVLILIGTTGNALCQNSKSEESTAGLQQAGLRGKNVFELKCATCHGLDGLGGEHAPDVVRRTAVKDLPDQVLLNIIHDGIPEDGMPGFASMRKEDSEAVVGYLRFLQGKAAGEPVRGDPAMGRDLFMGKGGCSACHVIKRPGEFVTEDLGGFARDHQAGEIRDAILRPAGGKQESVTVIARDGRKFSGMLRNEDNASLQLQDANGRFYLLLKSSLVSVQRHSGNSMPVDYGQRLNGAELDDLAAYILREAGAADLASSSRKD
jgi:cytochrome c oxidase cbb3-type subunit III